MISRLVIKTGVFFLLLTTCTLGHSFGSTGHRAVGVLAWQQLDPAVRGKIEDLIGEGGENFAQSCNWADKVRYQAGYLQTEPLHYLNIPPGDNYDLAAHCPEGNCVVAAIEKYARQLSDPDTPTGKRQEAVKFLCHFVGDVHSPLHVAYFSDRGGNLLDLPLGPKETINLHSLWDHVMPAFLVGSSWIDKSVATACPADTSRWSAPEIIAWAMASREYLQSTGGIYPGIKDLNAEYLGSGVTITRSQLCLAGNRLARLLNTVLAE